MALDSKVEFKSGCDIGSIVDAVRKSTSTLLQEKPEVKHFFG